MSDSEIGNAQYPATSALCNPARATTPQAPWSTGNLSQLTFVGRVAMTASGRAQYAWSGAGFLAHFRGRGLSLRLIDTSNQHTVIVDGVLQPKLVAKRGPHRYVVAEGLTFGEHTLEFYRRTEALLGVTTLVDIEIEDGELLRPTDVLQRRIEIVGDSISCGYGIEGADPACTFSADTENHYQTYGARLARRFHALVSTIAWSGRGVVKNYNGKSGYLMPVLYDRLLPQKPDVHLGPQAQADLVIINLGTNDFSTAPDPIDASFVHAYVALLSKVRHYSPDAFILTTIGPMLIGTDLERAEACIVAAVEQREQAGDRRIMYYKMQTNNGYQDRDWHPCLGTHEAIEQELALPIARALNW